VPQALLDAALESEAPVRYAGMLVSTHMGKMNKFKEYEFMEINYNKFMKLNKKEKLRKLKKQYRKLSLKYHPDKKTGSNESFNTLKSSYDLLFSVWFHS